MRARKSNSRARYRVLGGKHSVDLKLRTPHQLFDERDPAPFRERDLDDDAARYVLGSYRDLQGLGPRVKLSLYFEELGEFHPRPQVIIDAIHTFYRYEAESKRRELRDIFRQGLISLIIGVMFLFLCTWTATWITGQESNTQPFALFSTMREGLVIMGWVAMWRPISILLYEWWPIRDSMVTYQQLGEIDVDIFKNNIAVTPQNLDESAKKPAELGLRQNKRSQSFKREPSTIS